MTLPSPFPLHPTFIKTWGGEGREREDCVLLKAQFSKLVVTSGEREVGRDNREVGE